MQDDMRAWVVRDFAAAEPMRLETAPVPPCPAHHALVRVAAFGVNYGDSLSIRGKYQSALTPPFIAGGELSGAVVSGDHPSFPPGTAVIAQVEGGAAAEYCAVPFARLRRAPAALDRIASAAVSIAYPTAHLALTAGGRRVDSRDTVLVHAAAGGVGVAALQLARRWGARVIAVAGSDEKLEVTRRHGADHQISHRDPGWADHVREIVGEAGVDLVVDPVGGDVADQSLRLLAWRGRYSVVGFASGTIPTLKANRLLLKAATLSGVWWSAERDREMLDAVHLDLDAGFAAGDLAPEIGKVWDFDAYPAAIAAVAAGKSIGKHLVRTG